MDVSMDTDEYGLSSGNLLRHQTHSSHLRAQLPSASLSVGLRGASFRLCAVPTSASGWWCRCCRR